MSDGSVDAVADFGDDRRDVYKVYVHGGETLSLRTESLPLGGNLGLDVEVFPPNSTNLDSPPKSALKRIRPTGANGSLSVHNTTVTDDWYVVQVSARRGWGAYRLHWSVDGQQ